MQTKFIVLKYLLISKFYIAMKTLFDLEMNQMNNIKIAEYLMKIIEKIGCSDKVLVIALIYIQRYFKSMNTTH
jgi:hypothetical protein